MEAEAAGLAREQGLAMMLEGKEKLPESLLAKKKEEMMVKTRSTIQLGLADNVLWEVMEKKSCWFTMESFGGKILYEDSIKQTLSEEVTVHSKYLG